MIIVGIIASVTSFVMAWTNKNVELDRGLCLLEGQSHPSLNYTVYVSRIHWFTVKRVIDLVRFGMPIYEVGATSTREISSPCSQVSIRGGSR